MAISGSGCTFCTVPFMLLKLSTRTFELIIMLANDLSKTKLSFCFRSIFNLITKGCGFMLVKKGFLSTKNRNTKNKRENT